MKDKSSCLKCTHVETCAFRWKQGDGPYLERIASTPDSAAKSCGHYTGSKT